MNGEKTKPAPSLEHPPRPAWSQLFRTTEGSILLLGIAVAIVGLIIMGMVAFWSPQTSHMIGAMSFFNIIFGRAVSMSIGYAGGYGHALVITVNMWVETALVLLFYPVFVFSMRKLIVFHSLKRFLERTRAAAEHHHDKVRRYGIAGLFIFVWFPFWMTGPVVGSAIGYLLGFPARLTLSTVLAGTYIAMGGWAYLMFGIQSHAAVFAPWAPAFIVVLLILLVLAGYWLGRHGRDQLQPDDSHIQNKVIKQWSDDKVKEYLDQQHPDEKVEWIVLDESGLYGFIDPAGSQFASADDDEYRAAEIIQFLIRNDGSYISNAQEPAR